MTFVHSQKDNQSNESTQRRDFYFGCDCNRNEEWLRALKLAKKRYQDKLNRSSSSSSYNLKSSSESLLFGGFRNPYRQ